MLLQNKEGVEGREDVCEGDREDEGNCASHVGFWMKQSWRSHEKRAMRQVQCQTSVRYEGKLITAAMVLLIGVIKLNGHSNVAL